MKNFEQLFVWLTEKARYPFKASCRLSTLFNPKIQCLIFKRYRLMSKTDRNDQKVTQLVRLNNKRIVFHTSLSSSIFKLITPFTVGNKTLIPGNVSASNPWRSSDDCYGNKSGRKRPQHCSRRNRSLFVIMRTLFSSVFAALPDLWCDK